MLRFSLTLCVLVLSSSAMAEPTWSKVEAISDWKKVTTKKHKVVGPVEVYSKMIDDVPCFRAIAKTTATAEVMMSVATDIKGTLKWSTAGLTRSELLGQNGNDLDYLQYLDVPGWTFSNDRFWILRGTKNQVGQKHQFTWKRLGDNGGPYSKQYQEVKANSKAIEPPVNVGGWEFIPASSDTTVRYTICSDTGGTVPRGLQNMATKTTLPDTVGDLIIEAIRRSK